MNLRAIDLAETLNTTRSKCLGGLDLAHQTRTKVERTNQRMFITLVLIDRARRRMAAQPARART